MNMGKVHTVCSQNSKEKEMFGYRMSNCERGVCLSNPYLLFFMGKKTLLPPIREHFRAFFRMLRFKWEKLLGPPENYPALRRQSR